MEENQAKTLIERAGYEVKKLKFIPEGRSHDVFDIGLNDGDCLIARFEKPRGSFGGQRRDFHYNGVISLEREAYLCSLVREEASLPAPKVRGIYQIENFNFLLVEKMPGIPWKNFLEQNNYSLQAYLNSLEYLGADIAKAQRVSFNSFGDIVAGRVIEPPGITGFSSRLEPVLSLKIRREEEAKALRPRELSKVKHYFEKELQEVSDGLKGSLSKPILVLTDIHPMNFLVDEKSKPSGYFDLEFCQAGHPALETYYLGLQLFNYFDEETFHRAQAAFYQGYHDNGGVYAPETTLNRNLEALLCAGHTLSAVTAYHNVKDGLRDTWSSEFKESLFGIINQGEMNYVAFADVIRQKTKQPKKPN